MTSDADLVTPASRAFSLVVTNVVVSLFSFFALYFLPLYTTLEISSSIRLAGVITASLVHYSLGVIRSIHRQEMRGVIADSREIVAILYTLTAVNGVLITLLWWYNALEAQPVILLFPSYLILSFSVLHVLFRRIAFTRVRFTDFMTIAINGYSFLSCVIGLIRIRMNAT